MRILCNRIFYLSILEVVNFVQQIFTIKATYWAFSFTMADDFGARSVAFLSWLSKSGTSISSKIEITDLREQNAGRGVGTPILLLPMVHVLTIYIKPPQPT